MKYTLGTPTMGDTHGGRNVLGVRELAKEAKEVEMDRNAQIAFLQNCEDRVRSYASRWKRDPAVREALHRKPAPPTNDGDDHNGHHVDERPRKYG